MKKTLKLGLALSILTLSLSSLQAQDEKKYKIVIETIEDGKEVSIDTTFSDTAEMENYLKSTGHSIPKIARIPSAPGAPESPEMEEMVFVMDGTELTPEQKEKIETEMKNARKELNRARKEMKNNEKELQEAKEELEKIWMEVDENNENGEKIIIKKIGKGADGSEPKIIFIHEGNELENGEDVKIIELSGDDTEDNHQIKIIRKIEVTDDNDQELNWNEAAQDSPELALATTTEAPKESVNETKAVNETTDYRLPVSDFKLYPNPTKDKVTVSFNLETTGPVEIKLLDTSGKLIASANINSSGGFVNQEFDIEGKARGTYLMQIKQGDKWRHEKVVLK